MATLTIEGKKVKVDDAFLSLSPEEQANTVEEIASQIGVKAPAQEQPETESSLSQGLRAELSSMTKNPAEQSDGFARSLDSFVRGAADTATFGMADEIAGVGNTLVKNANPARTNEKGVIMPVGAGMIDAITGLFRDDSDTQRAIMRERAIQTQRDDIDPVASTGGRVAGALTSGVGLAKAGAPFMGALPADAGLAARVAQGAKAGALYSGLYGVGTGEGLADRATEGATSALTGAAVGGAIPLATSTVAAVTKPVRDAVFGFSQPEKYAAQKIAERLASAGMTAEQAAAKMQRSPGLSLADVGGDTTQNLLKTTTNIPGKAQARVSTQLAQKAMQQGDRIRANIKTLFADPDGYLVAKDSIAENAKKLAAPLYKQAYETPVPFTRTLEDILDTPAVKRALVKAEEKMANSQVQSRQMFANIADDGTVTIKRVPDTMEWDYIKRALDDQIGALKRSGENDDVRILTSLKNKMLSEIDDANPAFKSARQIWSGQAQLDDALEAGRMALKQSPEATRRMMQGMSAAEKETFKIGVADSLRDQVGKTGFTQNALLKFFSNRDQLANLRAAFDNDQQFAAFRKAMFAEARKRATYNVVTGNSSTARQLADMAESGGMNETVGLVRDVANSGVVGATVRYIGSRMKILGGFTPEVADEIAKRLMATNTDSVKAITSELARIEKAAISADQKRQLVQKLIAPVISEQATVSRQQ